MIPNAWGKVVRPLVKASWPRSSWRYSGITNVSPRKLAIEISPTMLQMRKRRSASSRRSSIGRSTWSSVYTNAIAQTTPSTALTTTGFEPQPADGPSLRAKTMSASAAPESTKPGTSNRPDPGSLCSRRCVQPNEERHDPDRDVDQEDPVPAGMGHEQATEHGPARRRGTAPGSSRSSRPWPARRAGRPGTAWRCRPA